MRSTGCGVRRIQCENDMAEQNFTYMFFGFAAAWLILAGYVLSLGARERKLKRQLEHLKRMMEDREES